MTAGSRPAKCARQEGRWEAGRAGAHGPVAGRCFRCTGDRSPSARGAEDPPWRGDGSAASEDRRPSPARRSKRRAEAPKTSRRVTGSTVATEQRKRLAAIWPLLVDGDEPDRHGRIVCGQTHGRIIGAQLRPPPDAARTRPRRGQRPRAEKGPAVVRRGSGRGRSGRSSAGGIDPLPGSVDPSRPVDRQPAGSIPCPAQSILSRPVDRQPAESIPQPAGSDRSTGRCRGVRSARPSRAALSAHLPWSAENRTTVGAGAISSAPPGRGAPLPCAGRSRRCTAGGSRRTSLALERAEVEGLPLILGLGFRRSRVHFHLADRIEPHGVFLLGFSRCWRRRAPAAGARRPGPAAESQRRGASSSQYVGRR